MSKILVQTRTRLELAAKSLSHKIPDVIDKHGFVPVKGGNSKDGKFTISAARYSKNKLIIQCTSGDLFKTAVGQLADVVTRGLYTHREQGYVASVSQARKFLDLYAAGWTASSITDKLIPPDSK